MADRYHIEHKEEVAAYMAEYYISHKAELLAYKARWRAGRREELKAYSAQYRLDHPEETKVASERYRKEHSDEVERWRKEHPEFAALWRRTNREKCKTYYQRYRSRKANAPVNDLTAAQWIEMKRDHGNRCFYCGDVHERLVQEHMTPLSRGGNNTISNVVPSCQSCNSRKHTKTLEEYYRPLWESRNYEG